MVAESTEQTHEPEARDFDTIPLTQLPKDVHEEVDHRKSKPNPDDASGELTDGSTPTITDIRQGPLDKFARLVHSAEAGIEQRFRRSKFHGWHMGVLFGCCMSALVLLCNLTMLIVGASKGYDKDGIADLITGEEATISRWNTAFHVLINALSTVLLSGSNYTMQVLSSPTRGDIDKAHAKKRWMEIGVLSPRNMCAIPRRRTWLCVLLSLSSIPLHLL
jgi:hypothetical protein